MTFPINATASVSPGGGGRWLTVCLCGSTAAMTHILTSRSIDRILVGRAAAASNSLWTVSRSSVCAGHYRPIWCKCSESILKQRLVCPFIKTLNRWLHTQSQNTIRRIHFPDIKHLCEWSQAELLRNSVHSSVCARGLGLKSVRLCLCLWVILYSVFV